MQLQPLPGRGGPRGAPEPEGGAETRRRASRRHAAEIREVDGKSHSIRLGPRRARPALMAVLRNRTARWATPRTWPRRMPQRWPRLHPVGLRKVNHRQNKRATRGIQACRRANGGRIGEDGSLCFSRVTLYHTKKKTPSIESPMHCANQLALSTGAMSLFCSAAFVETAKRLKGCSCRKMGH